MKVRALFPDGFRTGQTPKRQTAQISLERVSFSKIHFLPFLSGSRFPSPVSRCPILVRKPSGLEFLFTGYRIVRNEPGHFAEVRSGTTGRGPRQQPRGD
jgi:hypothetical protein